MNYELSHNVLLIESDPGSAEQIKQFVFASDFLVGHFDWCQTLREGIVGLADRKYGVVLLDLKLPDGNINTSLKQILEHSGDTPVIVLASFEDKELAKQLVHQGAQDYVCKMGLSCELLQRAIVASIERRRVEIALRDSEIRKTKIIESSLDGILTIDQEGQIVEFNAAAERTLGWKKTEVLGKNIDLFWPQSVKNQYFKSYSVFFKKDAEMLMGRKADAVALSNEGKEIPLEISMALVRHKGHPFVTVFFRDVTDQKRVEESLKLAKELAEESNRAKSAFLANMSHEIRTPLGAVLGFSELLLDPELPQAEKIFLSEGIRRNGELLSNIINDILDLSKVEAGKMEVNLRRVSLLDIISDVSQLLDLRASAKDIKLLFSIGRGVPKTITTDPIRLKQILINIIGNAIKFTDEGHVEVILDYESKAVGVNKLIFHVNDTGRGIAGENFKNLFTPFQQVDNSLSRAFGGTGLGLILSRRIANLLGGEVSLISSSLGKGSTFSISIDPKMEDFAVVPDPESERVSLIKLPADILKGVRVLLVDDSFDNRLLVNRVLKLSGAEVVTAENGKEAIEKVEHGNYQVLLMDLQMPVMDGYQATRELRKKGYEFPIIALTAHAMVEERRRCLENGFDDHISKPIDRDRLIGLIHHAVSRNHVH